MKKWVAVPVIGQQPLSSIMNLSIHYFASVKETLSCDTENVNLLSGNTVQALIEQLSQRDPLWQQTLQDSKILVAVNQTISALDTEIKMGDEIAFFPPVTGG